MPLMNTIMITDTNGTHVKSWVIPVSFKYANNAKTPVAKAVINMLTVNNNFGDILRITRGIKPTINYLKDIVLHTHKHRGWCKKNRTHCF